MEKMDLRPHGLFGGGDHPTDAPLTHRHPPERPVEEGCGCEHGGTLGTPSVAPLGVPRCIVPAYSVDGDESCGCVGHEGCGEGSWGLNNHPLAMVYAPCQTFCALHDPTTALHRGTLFSALDLPLGCAEVGFTHSACRCGRERT